MTTPTPDPDTTAPTWREAFRSPWFWIGVREGLFMTGTGAIFGMLVGALIMWKVDHGGL